MLHKTTDDKVGWLFDGEPLKINIPEKWAQWLRQTFSIATSSYFSVCHLSLFHNLILYNTTLAIQIKPKEKSEIRLTEILNIFNRIAHFQEEGDEDTYGILSAMRLKQLFVIRY